MNIFLDVCMAKQEVIKAPDIVVCGQKRNLGVGMILALQMWHSPALFLKLSHSKNERIQGDDADHTNSHPVHFLLGSH